MLMLLLPAISQIKPRIVVLTDIGRPDLEPDDTESLVRLLCYADLLEIEGIITSTGWNCDPYPEESAAYRDSVIDAYGKDVNNLRNRSRQVGFLSLEKEKGIQTIGYWPSVEYLRERSVMGSRRSGIGVIGENNDSPGSELMISLADEEDQRPIWVCAWGGANTLAQAIWKVKQTRSEDDLEKFIKKFRLYTITDQDMVYALRDSLDYSSHKWLRRDFPNDLLTIWDEGTWQVQCSLGIENWDFIKGNIQGHSEIGKLYPDYKYGVEGDTPSFFHVIPNGLHNPEKPMEAGWGGYHTWGVSKDNETYAWSSWNGESERISKEYFRSFFHDQLADFAARIEWAENGKGNVNPTVIINGGDGLNPIFIEAVPDSDVLLDASRSFDSDGDSLQFKWHRQEGIGNGQLSIDNSTSPCATVHLSGEEYQEHHIICEVHDEGPHRLPSYRRVIIHTGFFE